jgi:hypothetical protein
MASACCRFAASATNDNVLNLRAITGLAKHYCLISSCLPLAFFIGGDDLLDLFIRYRQPS